ncbi:uncharacterized protein L3040_006869 [Drepanopeziza brunnea f. sp. 'multigermtubi']|uniref:2EXR domain-containing protein n=1 Tax=Marssonina brunnea f. sp. multigermtubi (strain MB_m1) TaxID=1072389 RepID=K1W6T6_MARBU|nr:uncharacterized protein MBM_08949 [Drepanopeziza brunnea f. sp. 'multigermtubi' MB_m1]EKD12720.1 hypothetical protein MBM_08949 [Drepanopeziza brunnea f. sp. 'multigermtubi' MB_m1]KAJ5037995.1 hypothetical protein L3040_006869 [Drepanopeziza brunnea f. sp. 'multigermtubi']
MQRPQKFDPEWIDFFTSPCPYFVKQLTTFPQFSRFPREIQHMIWERAIPDRRVVQFTAPDAIQRSLTTPTGSFVLRIRYINPSILLACSDSRAAGLKMYEQAFAPYVRRPIYFNFERDYLELDTRTIEYFAELSEDNIVELEQPPRVKNLAVATRRALRGEDLVFYCQFFSGLERLLVKEPDTPDTPNTPSIARPQLPHTFQTDQPSFRHNWENLRAPIMKRVPFVRPALEKWEPPLLILGTDSQWSKHAKGEAQPEAEWGGLDPSSPTPMEWEPTAFIPSLEYVPRSETVGPRGAVVEYVRERFDDSIAETEQEEHESIKSSLFYSPRRIIPRMRH